MTAPSTTITHTRAALTLALAAALAWTAGAEAAPNANSAGAITGSFAATCTDFEAHSSKDISHVEIHYADGVVVKDETIDSPDFSIAGEAGDEIEFALVKSGTTEERFECIVAPVDECSDGLDNEGDGLVDYPNDPGCASSDDDEESSDNDNGDGFD
jgi:hypothetical protein